MLPEDREAVLAEARPDLVDAAWRCPMRVVTGPCATGCRGAMIPRVALVPKRFKLFFALPLLRRAGFHLKRMTSGMDSAFFLRVGVALVGFLLFTSTILTLAERNTPGRGYHDDDGDFKVGQFFGQLGDWFYWSLTTSFGAGDSSAVQTADRPADRLAAHPVRRRDRRGHHRCAGGIPDRIPAQGGHGHGCIGIPRPHRRLRLELDRA